MAKNRNTMAKRQRETDKRDKAVRKREKREERQAESKLPAANALAPEETGVLNIFRGYLMSAGKMLCLSGHEVDAHRIGLQRLLDAGMLEAESFKGGYSLTSRGYVAMQRLST